MKISFHGAAREVTGSCFLLEIKEAKILVDCGLFQGSASCSEMNFKPFQFKPDSIDAVIVTHAHIDHIGRLPVLVREGFRGPIYSTRATRDLAAVMLEDAMHIAHLENRSLFTEDDLAATMRLWHDLPYNKKTAIGDISFSLANAGHILGSALVEMWIEGKHVLFSGDLGNVPSVLLPSPDVFHDIEYLVIEGTYGNRAHESAEDRVLKLERAIEDTAERGGTLLIPAFATERTQEILHVLNELVLHKRVPPIPVFVDAPLATKITDIFELHPELYRDEIQALFSKHPQLFKFKTLHFAETVDQSKAINSVAPPKVIISGSGMLTGGRILHHALRYLPDPKSILLITGYQAAGSLGKHLLDGEKLVKILKETITVQAEIRKINGFSAHADGPQLYSFIEANRDSLKRVFVVHGEDTQAMYLAQRVKDTLGVEAVAPVLFEAFEL